MHGVPLNDSSERNASCGVSLQRKFRSLDNSASSWASNFQDSVVLEPTQELKHRQKPPASQLTDKQSSDRIRTVMDFGAIELNCYVELHSGNADLAGILPRI